MKHILYILILLLLSASARAQNYNPIHGNNSSRGVTNFDVPGEVSIGSSRVNSFRAFSTGVDRLRPRNSVRSANPFNYSNRATSALPKSGYGSVRRMSGQVNARIGSTRAITRVNASPSFGGAYANSKNQFSAGTSSRYTGYNNFNKFPLRVNKTSNPALKQLTSNNSSMLADRYKRLLQGNRKGRLSYSKVSMNRSLLNRKTRISGGSKLSSSKYSTSSILSNR